mgnify:CR=1 FL=1|tara:strand:- start:684 stop:983 length:300 start_codon:yes stop_codon:yes gene_type:complete
MKISIGDIFVAADIFYGPDNNFFWKKKPVDQLYRHMMIQSSERFYFALERAEIINADFEAWKEFQENRNIIWENGDVEPADLPAALFNGDIRRPEYGGH